MAAKLNNVDVVKASTSRAGKTNEEITPVAAKSGDSLATFKPNKVDEEFDRIQAEKRKNLERELLKLENKLKFISGVRSKDIKAFSLFKPDLVDDLRQRGFTPFPSGESSLSDYDYLLNEVTLEEVIFRYKFDQLCSKREILKAILAVEKLALEEESEDQRTS